MRTSYAAEDTLARVLHRMHARPLLAYVRRLLDPADTGGGVGGDNGGESGHGSGGGPALADNIVAGTLVRAVRAPRGLSTDAARARLFRDARALVVGRFRARDDRDPPDPPDRFGDAVLERVLLGWQVAEALESLSEAHRTLLVELVLAGRSVPRLATLLRISEDAVRHRTYFALHAFRLALEERGVVPR